MHCLDLPAFLAGAARRGWYGEEEVRKRRDLRTEVTRRPNGGWPGRRGEIEKEKEREGRRGGRHNGVRKTGSARAERERMRIREE